jgi:hypothetical protein
MEQSWSRFRFGDEPEGSPTVLPMHCRIDPIPTRLIREHLL